MGRIYLVLVNYGILYYLVTVGFYIVHFRRGKSCLFVCLLGSSNSFSIVTVFTSASSSDHCAVFSREGTLSIFFFQLCSICRRERAKLSLTFQGRVVLT